MSNSLQFYHDIVPIDRSLHKDWALNPIQDAGFSRNAHAVLLLGSEFVEASREYAIVFVRNGEQVMPVVMLGLREGENLFVGDNGKWDARYLPAYVRRYPFTFAEIPGGQGLLSLDSAYPGLDKEGKEGQRLFNEDGSDTDLIKNMLNFAQGFQDDYVRTGQVCAELDKLGLFNDMNIEATLTSGGRFNIGGFLVIDEQKLLALESQEVMSLFKSGIMGTIYAHMISLGNANQLINRLAEREKATPETSAIFH
jgi:hypothetical protein